MNVEIASLLDTDLTSEFKEHNAIASAFNVEMLARGKRKVLQVPIEGGGGHVGSSAANYEGYLIHSIE